MKIEDFEVGKTFYGSAGFKWLCTDKGSRVIIAIMLDYDKKDYWFNGPPYSVKEKVFDEHAMKSLYTQEIEMISGRVGNLKKSVHPGFEMKHVSKMMKEKDSNYPNNRLLERDRVSPEGYIFHPYAAIKKENNWFIKIFEIFSENYIEIEEESFVQLPFSSEEAMLKRKKDFNKE